MSVTRPSGENEWLLIAVPRPSTVTAMGRSAEVRGSVFWIAASGLVNIAVIVYGIRTGFYATGTEVSYGATEATIALLYFLIVYPCLREKGWGFIASMGLSAFVILATLAIEGLEDPIDVLFILMGLLTTYFSYVGYVKIRLH